MLSSHLKLLSDEANSESFILSITLKKNKNMRQDRICEMIFIPCVVIYLTNGKMKMIFLTQMKLAILNLINEGSSSNS